MTFAETVQIVSASCAVIAAGCAILAARRAGQWRETDTAQQLLGRVSAVEQSANDNARKIERVEREMDLKLQAIRDEIEDLPTRADIARVQGAIDRTCAIADRTELAVTRLQEFLMNGGKN